MPNDNPKSISELKRPNLPAANVQAGFSDLQSFELMQRIAKLFAQSPLVPDIYRGAEGIGSCVIALNMAMRMQADPLMVMQNLYVVYGRPAWSAQFLIACWNECGRYTTMRFRWVGKRDSDDWGCQAYATELSTGNEVHGPTVTIAISKSEGWFQKKGSKWQTIPELMLMYRAAAWAVRTNAPELGMGLRTVDEAEEIELPRDQYTVEQVAAGEHTAPAAAIPTNPAVGTPIPTNPAAQAAPGATVAAPEVVTPAPQPKTAPAAHFAADIEPAKHADAVDLAGGFTYAEVMDLIHRAADEEGDAEVADVIRTWKDDQQRAELDVELRAHIKRRGAK